MNHTPRWTFITNHGLVLSYIFHNPKSTARVIANHIGVTERTTHKIISDLEAEGYIERRKMGRKNEYKVDHKLPMRHHTIRDIVVEELLEALTTKLPPQTLKRKRSGSRQTTSETDAVPAL